MIKWRLILWTLVLYIFAAFSAQAENFYIENYEIVLEVSQTREVHVKENITAYFTNPSHGIIRKIPTKSSNIENVSVSEPFSKQYANGELQLKIGEPNFLISGRKVYQIEFDHQLYSNKNEFYYNLLGVGWDVPINRVRFYVKMPADVDADKVGISIGRYGTRGFDGGAHFTVNGAEIWGETTQTLLPRQGITLRTEVPETYFFSNQSKRVNFVWLGLLLCTLFSFMTWYQYGKDEHVTPVVSFNPPKEINSAEAELVMNEKITEKGLISLIVKLADEGCFKIQSEKRKFTFSDFHKYKGNNNLEHRLFTLLNSQVGPQKTVTNIDLRRSKTFYSGWSKLCADATTRADKKRFYEKSSMSLLRSMIMFLYIIGNICLTTCALFNYQLTAEVLNILPLGIFFIVPLIIMLGTDNVAAKIVMVPFFIVPMIILVTIMQMMQIRIINPSQVIMGIFCIIMTGVCYVQMLKPNAEGRRLKGRLLGLKKFIEVAEKKRLETLVEQNPQYFYKILPYAYILGVSKVWMKQFEGIALPPPSWSENDGFTFKSFENFTESFMHVTTPNTENGGVSHSSSRSSSFGGGGFSGGGFGGGGGSSW